MSTKKKIKKKSLNRFNLVETQTVFTNF